MEKICTSCELQFLIRAEDTQFYEKISPVLQGKKYLVPEPKFCPFCRERRRLAYRNERMLYKRPSSLSGQPMISFFRPDSPFTVYTKDEWWSDSWDACAYGRDFDFSRRFFEQFYELMLAVPRVPLVNNKAENSEYCNFADGNKNCYLITSANDNQDSYYSTLMANNRAVVDSLWVMNSELLYECIDVHKSYNVQFSQNCDTCRDSAFLLNCRGVANSLCCIDLRNKEYHVFNKPVSKTEFQNIMNSLAGSYSSYEAMKCKFREFAETNPIRRSNTTTGSEQAVGDQIINSQNVFFSFDVFDSRDIAYSQEGLRSRDSHDVCYFDKTEFSYESNSLIGYGYRFTNFCRDSADLWYCDSCHGCQNCFGCVGLRKKSYCIFNKQYSKEEYESLMAQIIVQMGGSAASAQREREAERKSGSASLSEAERKDWGEFFPEEYSIFPYEDSVAAECFPKNQPSTKIGGGSSLPQKSMLPDNTSDTADSVCNEILTCEATGINFRIIPQELVFYRNMKLPLPRKSPQARYSERLASRLPRKLWKRTCAKCHDEILTAYTPERPETIYCEACYLKKVY